MTRKATMIRTLLDEHDAEWFFETLEDETRCTGVLKNSKWEDIWNTELRYDPEYPDFTAVFSSKIWVNLKDRKIMYSDASNIDIDLVDKKILSNEDFLDRCREIFPRR